MVTDFTVVELLRKNQQGKPPRLGLMKEFVGLKLNIFSLLVDDSSEHKKANGENKNVVSKK